MVCGLIAPGVELERIEHVATGSQGFRFDIEVAARRGQIVHIEAQRQRLHVGATERNLRAVELAARIEFRPHAMDRDIAAQTAAGLRQPVAEAVHRKLDPDIRVRAAGRSALADHGDAALAQRQLEFAVDVERRRECQIGVARERTQTQAAAQVVEFELADRSGFFHISTCGQGEIHRAGPVLRKCAGIEMVGLGLYIPADLRFEHDRAAGIEPAFRLPQVELLQFDPVRCAVELERDIGKLTGLVGSIRSDREFARGAEFVGVAARAQIAVRGERPTGQIGGQFNPVPRQLQIAADRLGVELQPGPRGERAGGVGCAQVQRFQRQGLPGHGEPEWIEQHAVRVGIDIAGQRAAVPAAAAVELQRQRFERVAVGDLGRIECGHIQIQRPRQRLVVRRQRAARGRGERLAQGEREMRLFAIVGEIERADRAARRFVRGVCIVGGGNFPVDGEFAAAAQIGIGRQRAVDIDPAVGRAQRKLPERERRAGPARGCIQAVAGEQRLAVLADRGFADVQTVEQDVQRRCQQHLQRGRWCFRRCRRQRGQRNVDAVELHILQVQRALQDAEKPVLDFQRFYFDVDARRAVAIAYVVQFERADQHAARLRDQQFPGERRLGAFDGEARARFGRQ